LAVSSSDLVGRRLQDVFPDLALMAERDAEPGLKPKTQDQVKLTIGQDERTFAVQVTREKAKQGDVGSVVTFDDVTDLVTAQRTSAW
ncbi:PAS domain-containing sensor histidine kinase, partial [Acinetobacter baumannii]